VLLILVYRSCDLSSVRSEFRDSDVIAHAICTTYGFGEDPRGVYLFFIFFGLVMLLLLIIAASFKLWVTGRVPKILLVAFAHSVSPMTILRKVLMRR
jgi:hypothetical protein